jgi:phosphoglucosamine mutase
LNLTATSTGDGIIAGLQVITAMLQSDLSLHDLAQGMKKYPQVLINIKYKPSDEDYLQNDKVLSAVAAAEMEMGKSGRVLLRKSGTEPLIRVMVEAEDAELAQKSADAIADTVKSITTQ